MIFKNEKNRLGVMQGRLSPKIGNKIQAFPKDYWKQEFKLAREIGFELIEWVLDLTDINENPLLSKFGREEINRCISEFGILVPSVCCDYFVEYPLTSDNFDIRIQSIGMLYELIRICPEVGIKYIELPLISKSSINTPEKRESVVALLSDLIPQLEKNRVFLLLETDLAPKDTDKLFKQFSSNRIQLNYDTGNSAYWEFKPEDELPVYGTKIGNIHIKDCTPKDYSVNLGLGDVDFDKIFKFLKEENYSGDFILQTVRGENNIELAKIFYQFTNEYIMKYLK